MSKTKEEIKKEFSDALSSNTWKSLKTGLIGKELIAYASEFLYAMQTQNDAVTNSLKASTASINDIIALGYANDVALDLYEPSFIKVKITNYTGTEVIAPFAIRLTVGTFVFTNVDYYTGSE